MIAIFLIASFATQAQYIKNIGYGYEFKRIKADSSMLIPTFCGVPTLRNSNIAKQSALAYDSCNGRFYLYNPKSLVWDSVRVGAISKSIAGNGIIRVGDTLRVDTFLIRTVLRARADSIILANFINNRGLQQVTNAGSTSTNNISIIDPTISGNYTVLSQNGLLFNKVIASLGATNTLIANQVSGSAFLTKLPAQNGTLALSVNGVSAGTDGNILVPSTDSSKFVTNTKLTNSLLKYVTTNTVQTIDSAKTFNSLINTNGILNIKQASGSTMPDFNTGPSFGTSNSYMINGNPSYNRHSGQYNQLFINSAPAASFLKSAASYNELYLLNTNYTSIGSQESGALLNQIVLSTSTATDLRNTFLKTQLTGSSITNYYDLFIEAPLLTSSTIANHYSIYQEDGSAKNIFQGKVEIQPYRFNGIKIGDYNATGDNGIWFNQAAPNLTNYNFIYDKTAQTSILNGINGVSMRVAGDYTNEVAYTLNKRFYIGYNPISFTGTDKLTVNGSAFIEGNTKITGDVNVTGKGKFTDNFSINTANPLIRFTVAGGIERPAPLLGSGLHGTHAILSINSLWGLYTGVSSTGDVWQQVQRNDGNTSVYNLLLQPSGGNVSIGSLNATERLDVTGNINTSGNLKFGNIAGTSGQVVATNSSGNTAWVTPTYLQQADLNNYVTLNTPQTITATKIFSKIETDTAAIKLGIAFGLNGISKWRLLPQGTANEFLSIASPAGNFPLQFNNDGAIVIGDFGGNPSIDISNTNLVSIGVVSTLLKKRFNVAGSSYFGGNIQVRDSVQFQKLKNNATLDSVLVTDVNGNVIQKAFAAASATVFSTTGNALLNRITNYLGSYDTSQVHIKTKNVDAIVIDSLQGVTIPTYAGIGTAANSNYKLSIGGNLSMGTTVVFGGLGANFVNNGTGQVMTDISNINPLAGGLRIGGNVNATSSAMLDIVSTTKGVLFPRQTQTQRLAIPSPPRSLFLYDSTINKYTYWNGNAWRILDSLAVSQQTAIPFTNASGIVTYDSTKLNFINEYLTIAATSSTGISGIYLNQGRGEINAQFSGMYFNVGSGKTGGGTYDASKGYIFQNRGNTILQMSTSAITGGFNTVAVTGRISATETVQLGSYTVATLPAAGAAGRIAYVTDATAPTYNGTLTGGGTVKTLALDNGTSWTAH